MLPDIDSPVYVADFENKILSTIHKIVNQNTTTSYDDQFSHRELQQLETLALIGPGMPG